jgi:acyl dehydratase
MAEAGQREPGIADVVIGASVQVAKTITESDVYLYAGITGDFSPNHVNAQFMKDSRYGERVAHGAMLVGFMSAASAKMYLGRTVSMGYDRVRFMAPVRFGDTITTSYRVAAVDLEKRRVTAEVTCTNQDGKLVGLATNIRAFID